MCSLCMYLYFDGDSDDKILSSHMLTNNDKNHLNFKRKISSFKHFKRFSFQLPSPLNFEDW